MPSAGWASRRPTTTRPTRWRCCAGRSRRAWENRDVRRHAAAAWRRSSRFSQALRERPAQQRQRVGLVVVGRREAQPADGIDHRLFVGVALAGYVTLDRADRHALVRNAVVLAPGGEM